MKNYEDASTGFIRVMNEIKEAEEGLNGGNACFYSGYRRLDELTGGFRPGELVIIAGRPSMGKTALALSIVHNQVIGNNKKLAYISLGERSENILKRLLVIDSHIDFHRLRTGNLSDKQWKKLEKSVRRFGESKLIIGDDPEDIVEECRSLRDEYGVDGIFIDYIQLVEGKEADGLNKKECVELLRSLKKAASDSEIPIILLSQLSRKMEKREDKRPLLIDFREGRRFAYAADTVLLLYRDEYYNADTAIKRLCEVFVAKHIDRYTGRAELMWRPENLSFYDRNEWDEYEDSFSNLPEDLPFN